MIKETLAKFARTEGESYETHADMCCFEAGCDAIDLMDVVLMVITEVETDGWTSSDNVL
jgi:hypothetical protein